MTGIVLFHLFPVQKEAYQFSCQGQVQCSVLEDSFLYWRLAKVIEEGRGWIELTVVVVVVSRYTLPVKLVMYTNIFYKIKGSNKNLNTKNKKGHFWLALCQVMY